MLREIAFQSFLTFAVWGTAPIIGMTHSYTGISLKQKMVQNNGKVPKDGYVPKSGFVPNGETAIAIAIAVLIPIYG